MCACQQITRLHVWFLHTLYIYTLISCITLHCIALHCITFIHTHQSHTSHTSQTFNINTNTYIPKSHHITSNDIALHCIRYTFCKHTNTVPPNFDNDDPLHLHQNYMPNIPLKKNNCTQDWLRLLGLAVFSSIFKDGTFAAASAAAPTIGGRGLSCEFQKNPTFMPRFSHKKAQGNIQELWSPLWGSLTNPCNFRAENGPTEKMASGIGEVGSV